MGRLGSEGGDLMTTAPEVLETEGGSRAPRKPPSWFIHAAWRVHRALYRISGGRFLWTTSNKRGWGTLHLTTVGRRSGKDRTVIVGYLEHGPNLALAAVSGWGGGDAAGGRR